MTQLAFHKMHALGNDFILVDARAEPLALDRATVARLADRNTGIGFDQLLLLFPSRKADVACQFYNADGSEAEQCGNGLRCVARYLHEEKIVRKNNLTLETRAGVIPIEIRDYDHIRAEMGLPSIHSEPELLTLDGTPTALNVLSLGNPHAICRVPATKDAPVAAWGAKIEKAAAFPQGVNVGFMEILDRKNIRLRTFERGVGETLACGSNACAAVISGIHQGWLDSMVTVHLSRGNLQVEWPGENHPVFLTGPATRVFSGETKI